MAISFIERLITKKLDGGSAFSYRGKYFQLVSGGEVAATILRSKISVLTRSSIRIKVSYSGKVYSVARLEARPKAAKDIFKEKVRRRKLPKKPATNHP